jgi:hypothetical protein
MSKTEEFTWTPELARRLPALVEQLNRQAHEINELQMVNNYLENKVDKLEEINVTLRNERDVAVGQVAQMKQDSEFD